MRSEGWGPHNVISALIRVTRELASYLCYPPREDERSQLWAMQRKALTRTLP